MNRHHPQSLLKSRWSIRYGGFILVIFGSAATAVMYPTLERALTEQNWNVTTCTIASSELVTDQYAVSSLKLTYDYRTEGVNRIGRLYETPNNISRSTNFYRDAMKSLYPGAQVTCSYDPEHPETAVLRPASWDEAAAIIVPLLFIVLGSIRLALQYRAGAL